MADSMILVTGFPGFIAGRLIKELVAHQPKSQFVLLVQPHMQDMANRRVRDIRAACPEFKGTFSVVLGDIREPNMGMGPDDRARFNKGITHVWHLAAVYELSVALTIAYDVNVVGTSRVLDYCETLPNLKRLLYISSCYVAGNRTGAVFEHELDLGQEFKNHYETTKFWAEKLVQERWEHVPTTIFRPAIVVGDSRTGETIKGDGPYFMFNLLMRLPPWLPMVNIGDSDAPVNLVPVDFLVSAMATISQGGKECEKRVYQLADPCPKTAGQVMDLAVEALDRAPIAGKMPLALANLAMNFRHVERLVQIPKEAMVYFNHPVTFDTQNTVDSLNATEIQCPDLALYLPILIEYARANPSIFHNFL
ncbi:MAG: SDR family oxidoreductase [Myxococcota bacterium]|nr:SDR family oxidoreductase [Myxococcota bacterium]